MSAEPAYPYARSEPLASPAPEPRFHGTLAPLGSAESSEGALHEAAESIGNAVGKAVDTVQRLPERLQEMKQRFTVIPGRARDNVTTKAEELKSKAADVAADLKEQAAHTISSARSRAEHLAHEYPLQTILAMAGVGLVLGAVLRIWRDHAD